MRHALLCVFAIAALAAARGQAPAISAERLREHVGFLASDALEGRDTPSKGLDDAAAWIAARFEAAGLEPAFGGSFFQGPKVPDREGCAATLHAGGRTLALAGPAFVDTGRAAVRLERAPLVAAPDSWPDDEEAVAAFAKDQVVVLRVGADELARTGRRPPLAERRVRALAAAGARAVLLVLEGVEAPKLRPVGLPVVAAEAAALGGGLEGAAIDLRVPEPARFYARNVGALIRGEDPALGAEVIAFSAHYDHVGVGREVGGDRIYNGADDDATGTAAVIAVAEAFKKRATPPRRTVLFLCFYGEEKGFLGSTFYCEQPALPLARTKAVFNVEMVGRPDEIAKNEAWVTGWNVSDFGVLIAAAGAPAGVRFYEHKRYSAMLFGASDNIAFARRGVPAHSISAGSLHADYHQPSDEASKIDFENMAAVVRGLFAAGAAMADGGAVPTWKEGTTYHEAWTKLRE